MNGMNEHNRTISLIMWYSTTKTAKTAIFDLRDSLNCLFENLCLLALGRDGVIGRMGPVEDAANPVGGSVYRLKWEAGGCDFLGGPREVVRKCFRAVVND